MADVDKNLMLRLAGWALHTIGGIALALCLHFCNSLETRVMKAEEKLQAQDRDIATLKEQRVNGDNSLREFKSEISKSLDEIKRSIERVADKVGAK